MTALLLAAADSLNPISSGWLDYAKTLLVLTGISLLAFIAVRFWLPRLSRFKTSGSEHIQIFGRYPLEPRKTLYLVKAGKSVLLLASSDEGLQFMTTLDPADFENGAMTKTQPAASNFNRILRSSRT